MGSVKIKELYDIACNTPSQVNRLLPILYKYACDCDHITEMGIESVITTYAFLNAMPKKVVSYDVNYHPNFELCMNAAKLDGINWEYKIQNVTAPGFSIEETDMLFIDTLHTANQVSNELNLHSGKVRKYIAFHDVVTFGERGEMPMEKGINHGIYPFMYKHPEWRTVFYTEDNNGLLIIGK